MASNKGTSRQFAGTSESVTPSSYTLDYIKVTTNDGKILDIKNLVNKFEIQESINSPYLVCVLTIIDATNFLSEQTISGNEEVEFLIKRSPIKESKQNKQKFKFTMRIAEVSNYVRQVPNKQFYKIRLVSKHLFNNNTKILQRPFENTIGKLIQDICVKDLEVEKYDISNSSKQVVKGIYPTLKPIQAANWLLKNAFEDGTPYYFYETINGGVYVQSLKDMIDLNDIYETYEFRGQFEFELGTPESYDEVRKRIRKIAGPLGLSKFGNMSKGVYGGVLHSLDISNKKFEKFEFNYKKDIKKVGNLNGFFNYPENTFKINDRLLHDIKEARNYYISYNENAFDGLKNYHEPTKPTVLKSDSYYNNLNDQKLEIILPGDFELCAGKVIKLKIQKATESEHIENSRMIDPYLSGNYLVESITHSFDTEFLQNVIIKRNTLGSDINEK